LSNLETYEPIYNEKHNKTVGEILKLLNSFIKYIETFDHNLNQIESNTKNIIIKINELIKDVEADSNL
jgi:hypothetical protein